MDSYSKENYQPVLNKTKGKDWYLENRQFWAAFKNLDKARIAEIGCGYGALAEELALKFGLPAENFSLFDIRDFRQTALNFPFAEADLNFRQVPLSDNSCDLVISMFTIEHLENPFNLLREMDRILKPGGTLVIGMPNGWNIFSRIMFLFRNKVERYHRPGTLHISFMPKNIFWSRLENYELTAGVYKPENFFRRAVSFLMRNYRGRFGWLYKIKLNLPASEFFSEDMCLFLKKKANVQN